MSQKLQKSPIHILGAGLDLGSDRRGVDMGPSVIRLAGLNSMLKNIGHKVVDEGNLSAPIAETGKPGRSNAKYLKEIATFSRQLHEQAHSIAKQGHRLVVLGGDHTIAIGSISGVSRQKPSSKKPLGLLWVDAHADMNTPATSPSGNIHGMPLAILFGKGPKELTALSQKSNLSPKHTALIGIRSIDEREKDIVRQLGVYVATMRDIDERGLKTVMDEALERLTDQTQGLWVSLDMDGCDPQVAPGVGTPVSGGLTYRESHLIMEMAADTRQVVGMDIVEINPILDEGNSTAKLAVELCGSLFGKRIL